MILQTEKLPLSFYSYKTNRKGAFFHENFHFRHIFVCNPYSKRQYVKLYYKEETCP